MNRILSERKHLSAAVSEPSHSRYVGTALALQTGMGFLLTMVTIRLIPLLVELIGWDYVFMMLALGPAFGTWSMLKLKTLPEAEKMASGNR